MAEGGSQSALVTRVWISHEGVQTPSQAGEQRPDHLRSPAARTHAPFGSTSPIFPPSHMIGGWEQIPSPHPSL